MAILSIKRLCFELQSEAASSNFLNHPVKDIEMEANSFVQHFAKDNGLTANTSGAFRWYFQSGGSLAEDGLIEMQCKLHSIWQRGRCEYLFVNIDPIKRYKKSST